MAIDSRFSDFDLGETRARDLVDELYASLWRLGVLHMTLRVAHANVIGFSKPEVRKTDVVQAKNWFDRSTGVADGRESRSLQFAGPLAVWHCHEDTNARCWAGRGLLSTGMTLPKEVLRAGLTKRRETLGYQMAPPAFDGQSIEND